MDPTGAPRARPLALTTADGATLAADVAEPAAGAVGGAVLLHPHPAYGGNRRNHVVEALFGALPAAGWAALRFDFRPGPDHLRVALLDAAAALDELGRIVAGQPVAAVGYSFGAGVALALDRPDVVTVVAVAPPFGAMPITRSRRLPTLVLVAAHDQFAAPDVVAAEVAGWDGTTTEVVTMADHFLHGRARAVAERVTAWLARFARLPG